jgi:hypothetical protein
MVCSKEKGVKKNTTGPNNNFTPDTVINGIHYNPAVDSSNNTAVEDYAQGIHRLAP